MILSIYLREGAFVQGVGFFMLEEFLMNSDGLVVKKKKKMGKPTTQNSNHISHFSHPHPLQLVPAAPSSPCSGCKLAGGSGRVYSCRPCNFFLHESCSKMKQMISHPSHPSHTLTLLVTPVYDGGYFNCDACGIIGTGFSYQCSRCDFDIHALCAYKPLSIVHKSHPQHSLKLAFQSPYGANKGFSCDVCRKIGKNQWLYRCVPCEFDAHIGCIAVASTTPQPQHLQHSNSAPTPHAHPVGQPQHQRSFPMPNQGNSMPRPRPNGSTGNPGRPNGPIANPNRPIRNLNRPVAQNATSYGPERQNNMGYNGQFGPTEQNELTGQAGQSYGQGSTGGSVYDDSTVNQDFDVGEVDVEIEYEVDVYEENVNAEPYNEGQEVNADANSNRLDIVAVGVDYGDARSESSFGGSSDARSQCNDMPADLYPQGPVRVNQGSGRGRRKTASPSSSNSSTPRSGRSGPRGGLQGSNNPIQNPGAPQTRRVQNVRNRNNAIRGGGPVGFSTPRDVGVFNGPPQGFNDVGAFNGPPQGFNGPPQGFNGPTDGPSNAIDGGGNNYNNNYEVTGVDMYCGEDNVAGYEENYGDDYAGDGGDCDYEVGGDFVDDGYGDQAYDETYGENDFESYSDFTGGSESMYDGNDSYGTMDDSQYSGLNGEPNNQYLPMVGPVGGPGINNPNQYDQTVRPRNMGRARNMNMYGNMNQGANNIQPRTMGRGRAVQYRPNGGPYRGNGRVNMPNGGPNGPNGPNGNAMNQMVQGLCKGLAMNMLVGVGGDILGGGGDGSGSSVLGGLFGGDSESQF